VPEKPYIQVTSSLAELPSAYLGRQQNAKNTSSSGGIGRGRQGSLSKEYESVSGSTHHLMSIQTQSNPILTYEPSQ